jgi:uncharacterized protein YggT (Ycf19 family)
LTYLVLASALEGIVLFLHLYSWTIVISATLTLFTRPKDKTSKVKNMLKKLTDPVNNIFRQLIQRLNGEKMVIDISPILSLILIWMISGLLTQLAKYFYNFIY